MALTRRSAGGLLIGIAALVATASNPNFELRDMSQPYRIVRKFHSDREYDGSGIVYGMGYAAAAASCLGLMYNTLTGRLVRRE